MVSAACIAHKLSTLVFAWQSWASFSNCWYAFSSPFPRFAQLMMVRALLWHFCEISALVLVCLFVAVCVPSCSMYLTHYTALHLTDFPAIDMHRTRPVYTQSSSWTMANVWIYELGPRTFLYISFTCVYTINDTALSLTSSASFYRILCISAHGKLCVSSLSQINAFEQVSTHLEAIRSWGFDSMT